ERGNHTKKRQVPVTQVFPAAFGGQGIFLCPTRLFLL
ncbi:hypothetical protein CLOBOL_01175, partial [Enterocloster bolteae ATCC BAA-613]